MTLATALGVAAVVWPVALGGALAARTTEQGAVASSVVYLAASRVCHQRPERSFHTGGLTWPVCARCAGLYLAAPLGVLLATTGRIRSQQRLLSAVAVAAMPTAATWLAETIVGLPVGNVARFVAAAPLGAALTVGLMRMARPGARVD